MNYYDEQYFKWQKDIGVFGGRVNLFKFKEFISPNDSVIDFGCGGGYLLNNITCKDKIGIEVNDIARQIAQKNGIAVVNSANEIPDNWADVIISNHALEHTFSPLQELKGLYPKLKNGGKIVFVIPHEKNVPYHPNDINKHLYTWSQMNIGNLFTVAGFKVEQVERINHSWSLRFTKLYEIFGETVFHLLCRVFAKYRRNITQIRVIATKG